MNKKYITMFLIVICLTLISGLAAEADENDNIFLLDEIIVIATRSEEDIVDVPVSADVLTKEEIKDYNIRNISDALDMVAGVNINDYGIGGLKTMSIRGSTAEQVLIMVDGIPVNSSQNGAFDLSLMPIENVERIEIMRGPSSSLYGANALGGVINIVTKIPEDNKNFKYTFNFGSYNTRKHGLRYSDSSDELSYYISGSDTKSDGFRKNNWLNQRDYLGKFIYSLKDTDISFLIKNNTTSRGTPGPETYPTLNAEQKDKQTISSLEVKKYFENNDLDISIFNFSHLNKFDDPGFMEHSEHDIKRYGIKANSTYYLEKHTVTSGLEYKINTIDSTENGKHITYNSAVYVQDKFEANNKLDLTSGFRYDSHENFGTVFNPRVGLTYNIKPGFNLYTSYGKAFRAPTFNELYWPYQDYGSYGAYNGNPDLNPELSDAYEIGIRYSKQNYFEFNIFKKDITNLIGWAEGEDGVNRPYNVDSAINKGAELKVSREVSDNLVLEVNSSYLVSKDIDSAEVLDEAVNTNYSAKYKIKDFSTALSAESVRDIFEDNNYTILNLSFGKRLLIKDKAVELDLSVKNIADIEYEINEDYPMPGRNYTVELSTAF